MYFWDRRVRVVIAHARRQVVAHEALVHQLGGACDVLNHII